MGRRIENPLSMATHPTDGAAKQLSEYSLPAPAIHWNYPSRAVRVFRLLARCHSLPPVAASLTPAARGRRTQLGPHGRRRRPTTARTRPPLPEFPRSCRKMGPRRQSTSMSVGPASNCPGESWAAPREPARHPHGSSVARVSTSCAGRRATATSLRGLHGVLSLSPCEMCATIHQNQTIGIWRWLW